MLEPCLKKAFSLQAKLRISQAVNSLRVFILHAAQKQDPGIECKLGGRLVGIWIIKCTKTTGRKWNCNLSSTLVCFQWSIREDMQQDFLLAL